MDMFCKSAFANRKLSYYLVLKHLTYPSNWSLNTKNNLTLYRQ